MIKILMQSINGYSIQKRLLFFFLISIIIPVMVIGGFSYSKAAAIVTEKIRYTQSWTTYQISQNLDTILNNYKNIALSIYQDQMAQRYIQNKATGTYTRAQFQEVLLGKITQGIHSIYIFSKEGSVYGYDTQLLDTNVDYKELTEYGRTLSNGDEIGWFPTRRLSFFSPALESIPEVSMAFSAAAVIKDFDSMNEIGFLVINFKEDSLRSIYGKTAPLQDSYGFIIDPEGNVISHKEKGLVGKKLSGKYIEMILRGQDKSFYTQIDGEDSLIIYKTSNVTGWKLVNVIPVKAITKEVEEIKRFSLGLMGFSVLLALSMALIFSRSISGPIYDLSKAMKKVEKGDLSIRITPKYNDEIGQLGESFNMMTEEINYLVHRIYESEIMKKESEYKALQAQINPHFLYNTLESINWIARKHKIEEISQMVTALGDLMRISIRKDKDVITVREELKYIEDYLTIQKIRYRDKFAVEMDIDRHTLEKKIPKLIIQPIVENAIAHGIEKKVGKGTLSISSGLEDDLLVFRVKDDGVGMDEETLKSIIKENDPDAKKPESLRSRRTADESPPRDGENPPAETKSTRLGLTNVDRRIKMLFGDQYGLQIQSEKNAGTEVIIRFPTISSTEPDPRLL